MLLSPGFGWPAHFRGSTTSVTANLALTAGSHSQSGQYLGRLEATSEACSALSLKPK